MYHDDVTGIERHDRLCQEVRRHALQQDRRSALGRDTVGNRHETCGRHDGGVGVGAEHHRERDPISDRYLLDARADLEHLAGPLRTGGVGQGHRVGTGALLDVDHVHPGRVDADQRLALGRFRSFDVLHHHDVGFTLFVDPERTHLLPLGQSFLQRTERAVCEHDVPCGVCEQGV